MNDLRLWIFRLVTFVLIPVLLLGFLEIGLRLLGAGHSTAFTADAGAGILRDNEKFASRFFPGEIARAPLVFSFPVEKTEETYRIFILGASAAQGDPEPVYGFSRMLELMLKRRYPGVRFEVINTAVTAINSHVVRQIAREMAALHGDLFVIYLGNNEVVGPYGAVTVSAPFSPSLYSIRLAILLKSSYIGQSLARAIRLLRSEPDESGEWRGMEMFLEQQVRADDPGLERIYGHFRANLEDILSAVQRAGAPAIVSTVATNLRDSAPFASLHRRLFAESEEARWNALYQRGAALMEAGRYAEASERFLEAEGIDGTYAALQFRLGRCLDETGDRPEALRRYRLAQDLDTLRFRADSRINDIIREVAAGRTDEGVFLVDSAKAFEAQSADGIPGDDLFYEHVHLSFEGNHLLAASVFRQIEKIFPAELGGSDDASGRPLAIGESVRGLAFTGFDRHRISLEMLRRMAKPPFTDQLDHAERMRQMQRQVDETRRFTTPDALRDAARQYERAVRENAGDPWLHHNFGMLQYRAGNFEAAAEQLGIFLASLPHHSVAREKLLASLMQMGRFEEAVAGCREALRIDPDSRAARYTLALAFSKLGRPDDAIGIYRELLLDDPDRAPDIYNELGQLYVEQQNHAEAIEAFEDGLRVARDTGRQERPELAHNLGVALKRAGRSEEAARAFARAVSGYREELRGNPRSASLHFALGSVYAETRDFDNAVESFRSAVASNPRDFQARMHLAKSLEVQGRLTEALEALSTGVDDMLRLREMESVRALQRYRDSLQSRMLRDRNRGT